MYNVQKLKLQKMGKALFKLIINWNWKLYSFLKEADN